MGVIGVGRCDKVERKVGSESMRVRLIRWRERGVMEVGRCDKVERMVGIESWLCGSDRVE